MRAITMLGFALLSVMNGAVLAQGKVDPQSACKTGEPWFLPAAPAGGETSILVVSGATQPLRIRLCNCGAKEDGQTFIRVNPATATTPTSLMKGAMASKTEATGSALATQLYVGSCLEAMGNIITIRNTQPRDQRGTYLTR
jgi:hypothetical protein